VNSLPKTVTRQRRGCYLNAGPSAPESSMLTTRLPATLKVDLSKLLDHDHLLKRCSPEWSQLSSSDISRQSSSPSQRHADSTQRPLAHGNCDLGSHVTAAAQRQLVSTLLEARGRITDSMQRPLAHVDLGSQVTTAVVTMILQCTLMFR